MKKEYELSALEKLSYRIQVLEDVRDFLQDEREDERKTLEQLLNDYAECNPESHAIVKACRYRIVEYGNMIAKIDEFANNAL